MFRYYARYCFSPRLLRHMPRDSIATIRRYAEKAGRHGWRYVLILLRAAAAAASPR